ncbi:MAG: hypothetical protein HY898_08320 [Deltaproteobacteria bacterium]|nr:hypothetical protein [Deltaproteobacteria bacterium]
MSNRSRTLVVAMLAAMTFPIGCGGSSEDTGNPAGTAGSAGTDGGTLDGEPDVSADVPADNEVPDSPSPETSTDSQPPPDVAPDVAPACAPPSDSSKAALCVDIKPEKITPIAGNDALDGMGVLIVEVYDTPHPSQGDGGTVQPIALAVRPEQDAGTNPPLTMNLFDPIDTIRFDNLPAQTLYVRAYFFDNFAAFTAQNVVPGTWLGGYDLSAGMKEGLGLSPVALAAGAGLQHDLPLTALRALTINLSLVNGKSPLGDGQGPAGAILVKEQQVGANMPAFGSAGAPCVDLLAPGGAKLRGLLYGTGPYYALGYVDDYGAMAGNGLPPGTVVDVTFNGSQPEIPASGLVTYAADAYAVTKDLELNFVIPFTGTVPADTMQCVSDAGPGPDAATD